MNKRDEMSTYHTILVNHGTTLQPVSRVCDERTNNSLVVVGAFICCVHACIGYCLCCPTVSMAETTTMFELYKTMHAAAATVYYTNFGQEAGRQN